MALIREPHPTEKLDKQQLFTGKVAKSRWVWPRVGDIQSKGAGKWHNNSTPQLYPSFASRELSGSLLRQLPPAHWVDSKRSASPVYQEPGAPIYGSRPFSVISFTLGFYNSDAYILGNLPSSHTTQRLASSLVVLFIFVILQIVDSVANRPSYVTCHKEFLSFRGRLISSLSCVVVIFCWVKSCSALLSITGSAYEFFTQQKRLIWF